jgi:geranylgeranyl diphosphate synthase type I
MAALPIAIPPVLIQHMAAIELALRRAIGSDANELGAAKRYVMGWEDDRGQPASAAGKRIRPALCLFGAEAIGAQAADAMVGAVAVELVHNFSLVHDEVQDHDAERHHRATLWARLGEGQAINAGDALFAAAIRALSGPGGNRERSFQALDVLMVAVERMIAGQWQDISFERRSDVSMAEYTAMSAGKTGALLGAPLQMGALLAGAQGATAAAFGRWGENVGLAFQAQDDYLGIWGDPGNTGKSNTNDIARKKKSLPVVWGLLDPDCAPTLRRVYALPNPGLDDIARAMSALTEAGAAEVCRSEARRYAAAADAELAGMPISAQARSHFRAIADYMVDRSV